MERIQDFLAHKPFAFIGVSRQPKDFSRALFREFRARGCAPVPVHPEAAEIDGLSCFARLQDVQPPVDSVLLITSPGATDGLVQECASAGIERIWLYRGTGQGAVTPSAVTFCEANGISVIPGECPFMFFDGTPLVHRVHGLARKILGAYPR